MLQCRHAPIKTAGRRAVSKCRLPFPGLAARSLKIQGRAGVQDGLSCFLKFLPAAMQLCALLGVHRPLSGSLVLKYGAPLKDMLHHLPVSFAAAVCRRGQTELLEHVERVLMLVWLNTGHSQSLRLEHCPLSCSTGLSYR